MTALSSGRRLEQDAVSAPFAPIDDAIRGGDWSGGPEPVSGKIRSGISVYYRIQPVAQSDGRRERGRRLSVELRFENVTVEKAWTQVRGSDGVRIRSLHASGGVEDSSKELGNAGAQTVWRLTAGRASVLRYVVDVGGGDDDYLHLLTQQQDRLSSRSIVLSSTAR